MSHYEACSHQEPSSVRAFSSKSSISPKQVGGCVNFEIADLLMHELRAQNMRSFPVVKLIFYPSLLQVKSSKMSEQEIVIFQ